MKSLNRSRLQARRESGFSMIEVLVSILVLATGMLALSALQASVIQSASDAKARSGAATQAQAMIEALRSRANYDDTGYNALTSATTPTVYTLPGANVGNAPTTPTTYTAKYTVTRYVTAGTGCASSPCFVVGDLAGTVTPYDPAKAEFKKVDMTVEWTDDRGNAKALVMSDVINNITRSNSLTTATAKKLTQVSGPQVRIYPPTESGIIPIAIGENQAAAASNPVPEQYTAGVTGETKFSVQTYLQDQTNPLLKKKLDVALVGCKCTLAGGSSTSTSPSYEPSYWDGEIYTTPKEAVGKPVGALDTSVAQNDVLCTVCCRDHHDYSSSTVKFDPFRDSGDYAANRDHKHYIADPANFNTPVTVVASGSYDEACRMIRVDGLFRPATDTRLENLTLLRADNGTGLASLSSGTVTRYANFVKDYVTAAYAQISGTYPVPSFPDLLVSGGSPTAVVNGNNYDSILDVNHTSSVSVAKSSTYNLDTHGIYIDFISQEAKDKIACIGNTSAACSKFKDRTLLELVPFLAVNLTNLSNFTATNNNNIVKVQRFTIPIVNARGQQTVTVGGLTTAVAIGDASVIADDLGSNTGLVDTVPVDPDDQTRKFTDQEEFTVTGPVTPESIANFTMLMKDGTTQPVEFKERGFVVKVAEVNGSAPVGAASLYDCGVTGNNNNSPANYPCQYNNPPTTTKTTITDITLSFANYVLATCPNKYTLQADGINCQSCDNKGVCTTVTATITNFEFCGMKNLANGIDFTPIPGLVTNDGTGLEVTQVHLTVSNVGKTLDCPTGAYSGSPPACSNSSGLNGTICPVFRTQSNAQTCAQALAAVTCP